MTEYIIDSADVVVIGGGHAGAEAALAAARSNLKTILFAVSLDSIAMLPCNPSIGGTSKGHLVREVDALGGEMGKNIDKTYIQSRMLNQAKGPAVHSLRAQADKHAYSREMKKTLENTPNLKIKQTEVIDIVVDEQKNVRGVKVISGGIYQAKAVIIATGTYLKARCIYGDVSIASGPNGLQAANHLSDGLRALGIKLNRFKTGTPSRVDRRTIDFSQLTEQPGDERIVPFSFENKGEEIRKDQISCWLAYTNQQTAEIISANLDRSPLYGGVIKGTGPRYCPSIEDKVVRFADKEKHQIFVEPEAADTNEMYLAGLSSSLPEDVQIRMIRTLKGFEHCEVMRIGYAIEYDCIDPLELKPTLELKAIRGLFSAGQFNGSSGYEEAAAQGLMAGINATAFVKGTQPLILDRSEAYIGVLIDDLVTKGTNEPYRMMTSRAEYRLLLRQDNADLRLSDYGWQVGLLPEERYRAFCRKREEIEAEVERLHKKILGCTPELNQFLESQGSTPVKSGISLYELLKRPEITYESLAAVDRERAVLPEEVLEQVNIQVKYEGYIARQTEQVEKYKKLENKRIPDTVDYDQIGNLRTEARQKLKQVKPLNIGQASRISGVSPADISVLLIYLSK
ncbi:tRNA uridine-5-carboxymethylaminomethyl(34) synthesis enzyme MnmG [Lachnospiraceae bacterium oral taxon 500]|nr:tRNA uridine-5-carboxymethylaminomethyl(34) synthesis enzyme MnmG [Lachnospiraceae bacterium oral taxon 500]